MFFWLQQCCITSFLTNIFDQVVELLLLRGANKEHRNVSDYTPLSLAASGGYVNIIKILLNAGAEINSRCAPRVLFHLWPLLSGVGVTDEAFFFFQAFFLICIIYFIGKVCGM